MKYLILGFSFFISINCFAWFAVVVKDINNVSCVYQEAITPSIMLATATSEDGGYTKCDLKKPEKDVEIVICRKPTPNVWFFVKNLAKCRKYEDFTTYRNTIRKYMVCKKGKEGECSF